MARTLIASSVPADRCIHIHPAADILPTPPIQNQILRQAMGFDDSDFVILSPGESTHNAGHREALWTVAILNVLDSRYRLLLWGRGPRTHSIQRIAERLRQENLLTLAEDHLGRSIEFEELPTIADAVLDTSRDPVAQLPLGICLAAGLPLVSARNSVPAVQMLARQLRDLREDMQLRQTLSAQARQEAIQRFSISRFIEEWRVLYRRLHLANSEDTVIGRDSNRFHSSNTR